MILIAYVMIVLFATTVGAIAGLGGGVIIKPLFDLIGYHDASTISVYSSFAVFTMCLVSILKQIQMRQRFCLKMIITISMGSLLGGICGENIFALATSSFTDAKVKIIQSIGLLVTLLLILLYTLKKEKLSSYHNESTVVFFLVGFFLGTVSVFLGIGGGPLNVAVLMIVFSLTMKEATIYSIVTIFFSQLSKLSQLFITRAYLQYDLSFIPFLCVTAILGGLIGTWWNQHLENKEIEKIYIILIYVLIGICLFNIFQGLYQI